MKPKWIIVALLALLSTTSSCQGSPSAPLQSVTLGTTTSEVNALILIAQDQGFFANNGLEVIHKIYPSGVAALDGLLGGEIDLATGSEFAFVNQILAQQDVYTIAAISRSSIEYLVARLDRGIHSLSDLEGKTIGVPLGSRPEFALDRFFYFQGIDSSQVTLIHVPVNQSVDALVRGEVDAVAAWHPYIDQIEASMGDEVISWSVQEDQPSYTLLMGRARWTQENRELIAQFLQSLVEVEGYLAENPEEARASLQKKLDYSDDYMDSVWPNYSFSVMLDQALVVAMEDEARWIIRHGLTTETQTPNVVAHIDPTSLEAVKPEAVNLIR